MSDFKAIETQEQLDAIIGERIRSAESKAAETYANIIAVRADKKDSEKTKALVEAIQSEEVKKFIEEKYSDAVVPVF